jgi:hypothetical protein
VNDLLIDPGQGVEPLVVVQAQLLDVAVVVADANDLTADLGVGLLGQLGGEAPRGQFLSPSSRTARNASWGTSMRPTCFMRCFPFFWASRSLRLREMSPP